MSVKRVFQTTDGAFFETYDHAKTHEEHLEQRKIAALPQPVKDWLDGLDDSNPDESYETDHQRVESVVLRLLAAGFAFTAGDNRYGDLWD